MDSFILFTFFGGLFGSVISTLFRFSLGIKYDFRRLRWQKNVNLHPHARHLRRRPLLTIAVYVEDTAYSLNNCLASIVANDYRKYEVLIINNASTDNTKQVIKQLQETYPNKIITTYTKRIRVNRSQAIANALKAQEKRELVLVIDASSSIVGSLQYMVRRMSDKYVDALILNAHTHHNYRLLGIVQEFHSIVATLHKRSGLVTTKAGDRYNYASCYKHNALSACLSKKSVGAFDDINVLTKKLKGAVIFEPTISVRSLPGRGQFVKTRSLLVLEDALLLQQILFAGITTYIAIAFQNSHYLFASWLLFTLILLIPLWTDSSRNLDSKWPLSFIALLAYPLYFLDFCIEVLIRLPARYASSLSTIK